MALDQKFVVDTRTTPPTPAALMSNPPETPLARRAGDLLGPGRHAAILALAFGCPVETARSYTRGRRRLPAWRANMLARVLRAHAGAAVGLALEIEAYARAEERRPKPLRGFCAVRIRDASGIPRDARWRGGRCLAR